MLPGAGVLQRVRRVDVGPDRARRSSAIRSQGRLSACIHAFDPRPQGARIVTRVVGGCLGGDMLALPRTVLCSRPSAFVRCMAVTGSFQMHTSRSVYPSLLLKGADQVAAEVTSARCSRRAPCWSASTCSGTRGTRPRLRHPAQFADQVAEVLEELSIVLRQLPMSRGLLLNAYTSTRTAG
jgi:hypothetical protein